MNGWSKLRRETTTEAIPKVQDIQGYLQATGQLPSAVHGFQQLRLLIMKIIEAEARKKHDN